MASLEEQIQGLVLKTCYDYKEIDNVQNKIVLFHIP